MSYLINIIKETKDDAELLAYQRMLKEKGTIFVLDDEDVEVAKKENPIIKFIIDKYK